MKTSSQLSSGESSQTSFVRLTMLPCIMSAIVAFFIGYHMNKSVAIRIDQRPISDRDGISQKEDQVRVNAKEMLGRPVAREKVGTAKMSVDEALKKIQAFNLKHESINERASFATEIVEKLCANGQISEAWQVIDPASGSVRTRQIYAFFRNAGLDVKQLTEYCSSFVDSFDVSVSTGAFFSNKSLAQIANLRKELGFDDLEKIIGKHSNANFNVSKQIKYALENLAERVSHKEKAEVALHLCKDKILKVNDVSDFILFAGREDSFGIYESLKENVSTEMNTREGKALMSNAIASMLQDNPKECVALMLKDSKGDASWNLTKSFELWTGYDAKGAYDWFMTHQSDLNQAQRSAAAMGFFVKAIETGELQGATTWNEYITDPRIKKVSDQVLKIKAGK